MKKLFIISFLVIQTTLLWSQVIVTEQSVGDDFPVTEEASTPIVVSSKDGITVGKVAQLLAADIARVTGKAPAVLTTDKPKGRNVIIVGTTEGSPLIARLVREGRLDVSAIRGGWEQYVIKVVDAPVKGIDKALVIVGSDRRGAAYGAFTMSEAIGVSPWYWWADVPVKQHQRLYVKADVTSTAPTVKYRGIFINDEDWGLKPWASQNYEKELGDIGPRTYARVCELLLRLKANMLAPAMHECTGAFYTHPESKVVADSFGIIITTSHCEPLLINNASKAEWDQDVDGDWNYKTNSAAILKRWDKRLAEASCYENIYTTAMRGLHDAGLRGNLPMEERVPLITKVIADQRALLEKHIGRRADEIPQIFVPYKETMDIYENGLKVPDDVTLVWVDDNYGYMKRVANPDEQRRSGGSGVYYHISYLGAPHDYLWINTTPPVLMYEELKKAYDHGADRYWLLNVGDIKPMELGIQSFMDMAWDINAFSFEKVKSHQAEFLAKFFGGSKTEGAANHYQLSIVNCQFILDEYYRLAWSHKPEYMGWEYEWDDEAHTGLKDTEYSFKNYAEAQCRLADYKRISDEVEKIANSLNSYNSLSEKELSSLNASWFELVQFPVQGAYQMNRKFLMAQLNHELLAEGKTAEANWAARQMELAYDSINALNARYNNLLDGKWRGMMALAPAFRSLNHLKPEVTVTPGVGEKPVDLTTAGSFNVGECYAVNLAQFADKDEGVRIIDGLGYDWQVLQLQNGKVDYALPAISRDSVDVFFYAVPFWPLYKGMSNRIGVSMDGGEVQVFENKFREYSRSWKDQVMRNGIACRLHFAIDSTQPAHTLTFHTIDAGQMVQKVVIDWGGLKVSYIGPSTE